MPRLAKGTAAPTGAGGVTLAWNKFTGGAWATPGTWTQNGTLSAAAAGVADTVVISSAIAGFQVINGNGNSARMTLTGETALNGVFNTGSLALNANLQNGTSYLVLLPSSVLTPRLISPWSTGANPSPSTRT